MLKDMGTKRRFTLMLIAILLVSLPVISAITYLILRQVAMDNAYASAKLYLSTIEAVRHYVADDLRPVLYRELPGRFVLEGMSRSYMANTVAGDVFERYPGYRYKNAIVDTAMNPRNHADAFEREVISRFVNDRGLREWQGMRSAADGQYYVLARPGEPFDGACLACHGDPEVAPKEIIAKYGTENGFRRKIGDLADAKFVYIPIALPLAAARRIVAVFVGLYALFGASILAIVHFRFSALYNRIETDKRRIEDINLELLNLNQDMESLIAERTMNLIALSVADRIRNPATVIAGTFNRILRKEELSDPLRERLTDMLSEAQKLDSIVRDYETILKSKRVMFRGEDMNEIIRGVIALVEGERRARNVRLELQLADNPVWFTANRQIMRVAVLHLLKNAIEATPSGGMVAIRTEVTQDNAVFSISDTGKGIGAEDLQKIFSLFYSTKRHRLGMGLPLVKQIVEEHRGSISVESAPGEGTTFTITVPVRWTEEVLKERPNGEQEE